MSDHIGTVIEPARQTGESLQKVVAAADQLAREADSLRTEVDSYLANTRAV